MYLSKGSFDIKKSAVTLLSSTKMDLALAKGLSRRGRKTNFPSLTCTLNIEDEPESTNGQMDPLGSCLSTWKFIVPYSFSAALP